MKYLLKQNKEDKGILCDKVTIDGFDYYYIDELIPYNPNGGTNGNFVCLSEIISNKEYGVKLGDKQYISPFVKNVGRCGGCRKLIATNNPNIDLPKVVDEVEKLAVKCGKEYNHLDGDIIFDHPEYFSGFFDGYNKSQETHPYSEDFFDWIDKEGIPRENGMWIKYFDGNDNYLTTKELLQFWKEQQPKVIYYE